jgi:hypothetical protein
MARDKTEVLAQEFEYSERHIERNLSAKFFPHKLVPALRVSELLTRQGQKALCGDSPR